MLVRQFFNHPTFSYTYLLADPLSEEAVLIDPIKEKLRDYVQLFNELGYILTAAINTHTHDDNSSGLVALRDLWGCDTIAGIPSEEPGLTHLVEDGDVIVVGALQIDVIHTPGHTEDSYCFFVDQPGKSCVFTGDTLLVRTVGLSDQPSSNPRMHYDSLMNVLSVLPDRTLVYPGKDFKGWPLSTMGEEKQFNPYMNTGNVNEFIALKNLQKPADIQPAVSFDELDESDATDPRTTADMATAIVRAAAKAAAKEEPPEEGYGEEAGRKIETAATDADYAMPADDDSTEGKDRPGDVPIDVNTVPSWR
jgi:glyoxylase-like metal-dependent hydrolase (beta-lactamase superfamily II)